MSDKQERDDEEIPGWEPSAFTKRALNDAFQFADRHSYVRREFVERLLAREFQNGTQVSPGWPAADLLGAWAELTGYVAQACEGNGVIDAGEMRAWLLELKREAMKPIREHMTALLGKSGNPDA